MIMVYGLHITLIGFSGIKSLEGGAVKKDFLIAVTAVIVASLPLSASAQEPRTGQAMRSGALVRGCSMLADLDLSKEQQESLKHIDGQVKDRILELRNGLMLRRLELRSLLRDPHTGRDAIQKKAREMGALREALQQEMIDYQIQAREILTPDQIRRWCTMMGEPQGAGKGNEWCR